MKSVRISPLWIVISVLALCLAGMLVRHNVVQTRQKESKDSLRYHIAVKDSQIVALNDHYAALERELSVVRYNDSLKAKSVVIRDVLIARLKARVSLSDSMKNWDRDSVLNWIVGGYAVERDTLILWGGDMPWKIAADINKGVLLDSILPVMDKQIGDLKALNSIRAKAITNLTGQVVNRDSVVRVQMSQLLLKNGLIEAQGKEIKSLKIQRVAIAAGGVILLIIAL